MSTELIQARIRTKLGNIVVRRVKPDNPNIVEVVNAPQQAARRARNVAVKPKPAKPDPVESTEPKLIRTDWLAASHHGCCGGRVLIAVDVFDKGQKADEEALRREWEGAIYGKRQFDAYVQYVERAEKGKEHLIKTGRNLDEYYYYRRADFDRLLETYTAARDQYSWEACLARGAVFNAAQPSIVDPAKPLVGVTVSVREFPGSHQSPAGLWMRSDKEPGRSNPMRLKDVAQAITQPDKIVCHEKPIGAVARYGPSPQYPTRHHILAGMSGRLNQAGLNWQAIKRDVKTGAIKVGDLITFILNHSQNDPKTDESLAAAGFQCVLVTGNSTHGDISVLYLYERRITERDVELLNGG